MKRAVTLVFPVILFSALGSAEQSAKEPPLLSQLPHAISTVPANGDLNPYGTAFVPRKFREGGPLEPGDLLVSNFNGASNRQGTGTTIVRIGRKGTTSLFFQAQAPAGLTTALGILRAGFVIVGNLPTRDGTSATIGRGSLIIIDCHGHQVGELKDKRLLDGPWDLTVQDEGDWAHIFVSNVISGTVTRLTLRFEGDGFEVSEMTRIASGYMHRFDPAALVIGPTGLAYDRQSDTLFVASTGDNEVFGIEDAASLSGDQGRGNVVVDDPQHLHGPLGLVRTPSGHLIIANGDAINPDPSHPSELEEFSAQGEFLASYPVDTVPGAAFGIALARHGDDLRFAAVDDNTNTVTIWRLDF